MHGWVRLEVPCKADYDCGDMVGLYPSLSPPPGPSPFWCLSPSVCLATIDARLVNTPRLSPGCPRRSVISWVAVWASAVWSCGCVLLYQ